MLITNLTKFYINGKWVDPVHEKSFTTINPATGMPSGSIWLGSVDDVNIAVKAAKESFKNFSTTEIGYRRSLLEKIISIYKKRFLEIAEAVTLEMGAPIHLAQQAQTQVGIDNLEGLLKGLDTVSFVEQHDQYELVRDPVGVCGLITPWNWPLNQVTLKVGAAIAAGCTMVLKPSEYASFSAQIFAEIIEESRVPDGVFNMIYGLGNDVGAAITNHPDVDLVSFTGSLAVGKSIISNSSHTLKRVTLELGGKSPYIITPDANLKDAVTKGVEAVLLNSGQSCSAPTRMLVHRSKYDEALQIAKQVASQVVIGDPTDSQVGMGPLVNQKQYERVRKYIDAGIGEGARLITERAVNILPEKNKPGYYIAPAIFADVNNQMTIAREEIFGPVLCIIPYDSVNEAVDIANDSIYGLSAYVYAKDTASAQQIAKQLKSGNVHLNSGDIGSGGAPFGGYKQSGIGREGGKYGLEEFLEIKAII